MALPDAIRLLRAPVLEVATARRLAAIYGLDGAAPREAPEEEVDRARGRLRRSPRRCRECDRGRAVCSGPLGQFGHDSDLLARRPAHRRTRAGRSGAGPLRRGVARAALRRSDTAVRAGLLGAQPAPDACLLPGLAESADAVCRFRGRQPRQGRCRNSADTVCRIWSIVVVPAPLVALRAAPPGAEPAREEAGAAPAAVAATGAARCPRRAP
jgi:hypothetical protein